MTIPKNLQEKRDGEIMSPFVWFFGFDIQFGKLASDDKSKWQGYNSFQIGRYIILWRLIK